MDVVSICNMYQRSALSHFRARLERTEHGREGAPGADELACVYVDMCVINLRVRDKSEKCNRTPLPSS